MKAKAKAAKPVIPATRDEAIATGSKVYLGKPCRAAGHHEGRAVNGGGCLVCHRMIVSNAYRAARELIFAATPAYESEPYVRIPDDWMTRPLPKPKRVRRKAGESFAGESDIWRG
jgi:hypothetical protein